MIIRLALLYSTVTANSGLIQHRTNSYFSYVCQKTGFDSPCKFAMETVCMKYQNLFSGKNK